MEGDSEASGGGGHASSGNSRWNPTKEQISMLENLYNQGVRTPRAEQIQQITTRLRAFGIIEGKNVFYWFQNHKARQRQKQKQDSLASFNRFLHQPTPPFHVFPPYHPPSPNVVCSPYYVPQSEIGLYQQCPKVFLPSSINRRSSPRISGGGRYHETVCSSYGYDIGMHSAAENVITSSCSSSNQKTLALFPMHPTGILQGKSSGNSSSSISTVITTGNSNNAECSGGQTGFYDFFSTDQGSFVID